jgi:hypothetical protein
MNLISTPPVSRWKRLARAATAAGALTVGVFAVGATVSANEPEQAVEALPTRVSDYAREAMDALSHFQATGDLTALRSYQRERAFAAIYTAQHLGYNQQEMVRAWSSTSMEHQEAVLGALTQLGVPYRYGSSAEGQGFDCSGLTSFAWREAGHEIARQSGSQISSSDRVDRSEAKAGDLAYYPGHVMLYLGVGDAVVHAVQTGRDVELDHMTSSRSITFGDPLS